MDITEARRLDKFFTAPSVAKDCMLVLHGALAAHGIGNVGLWLEPSAGSGAFLDLLPHPRLGLDLVPEADDILQADFLTWQPPSPGARIVAVGNPPFGKNASRAVAFFNHAARFSTVIAMVFPRTFEKASIHRRLDQRFHLIATKSLPDTSFLLLGKPYSVPAVFQVWMPGDGLRSDPPVRRSHPDFEFVDRNKAQIAFQRVGVRAGAIKTDLASISPASHLFIRATSVPLPVLIDRIDSLDFSTLKLRTAGNPSIAKSELIELYSDRWGDGS